MPFRLPSPHARYAQDVTKGRDYLDFGSGTGTTAQLFARLGFRTTMADISTSLLDYASWRMERHGDQVTRIDLGTEQLPTNAYDFITALDTLVHVPDFDATAHDLRRVIRPGGYLLANFDVRAKDDYGSLWHLHNDIHVVDHRLRAAGFVRTHTLADLTRCYVAVDPTRLSFKLAMAIDTVVIALKRAKSAVEPSCGASAVLGDGANARAGSATGYYPTWLKLASLGRLALHRGDRKVRGGWR